MKKALAVALLASLITGCATNYQVTRVETGRIIKIEQRPSEGSWGGGALVGGAIGLATSGGRSDKAKLGRTLVGALAGGAVEKGITHGSMETYATVRTLGGQVFMVQNASKDLMVGDCVQAEMGSTYARLKRTSDLMCN